MFCFIIIFFQAEEKTKSNNIKKKIEPSWLDFLFKERIEGVNVMYSRACMASVGGRLRHVSVGRAASLLLSAENSFIAESRPHRVFQLFPCL